MAAHEWVYYQHAMIPDCAACEEVDASPVTSGAIWHGTQAGVPLLARWITDWDCGQETNWWYVIKDAPLELSQLKAKRRYEINRGLKNFEVRPIAPEDYPEQLYAVQVAAFSAYPAKYRPTVDRLKFLEDVTHWGSCPVYGAFSRQTGELAGYALLRLITPGYLDFTVLKTKPQFERQAVNAALVASILEQQRSFLASGGILCDGARCISHETGFQDYLEKYFGFRRAYCTLHVAYRPGIRWVIRAAYPFRRLLKKLDAIGIVHQLNGVLKMEEIVREAPAFSAKAGDADAAQYEEG